MTNKTMRFVKCPKCSSLNNTKDGLVYFKDGIYQRYLCSDCGRRFKGNRVKER